MERTIEQKEYTGRIESKATDDGRMHITAYGLAFGNVDSYGDIIMPTACNKWMQSEDRQRLQFCYQHDMHNVVGKIDSVEVDEYGLKMEVTLANTQAGKDLQELIDLGAIKEFSIGYYTNESEYDQEGHRLLKEISIVEISAVSRAANPKAVLTGKKDEQEPEPKQEPDQAQEGEKKAQEEPYNPNLGELTDEELNTLSAAVEEEQYRRVLENL